MGFENHPILFPIKGYVQEARTYLAYPFHYHQTPSCKFIILSQHRSGSSLLVSLLDSHPDIHCEGELFYHRKFLPMNYLRCRSKMSLKPAFGFKLMTNHIGYQGYTDYEKFIVDINKADYKIIRLVRKDLNHAAISLLYAQKCGKYHYSKSDESHRNPRIVLDPDQFMKKLIWLENISDIQSKITEFIPHLAISYEDHLRNAENQQSTVDDVTDFLKLSRATVKSDLIRTSNDDYSMFIENYNELLHLAEKKVEHAG